MRHPAGAPTPPPTDYRAAYTAARHRIVELETQVARLLAAADRPHDDRLCPHVQPLAHTRRQLAAADREITAMHARIASWIDALRGVHRPAATPPAEPLMLPTFTGNRR